MPKKLSLSTGFGRHGLSCRNAKGTFPRHQQVNDLLKRALASAQVSAIREPTGLTKNNAKRPDGLTLFPWQRGKCLIWDYTCRDSLAPTNVMQSAQQPAKAATKAEIDKSTHYQELASNYTVTPVANETMGSWGPSGLRFVKDIGQRIEECTGEKTATSFLFQAISMATQRGNIGSIRGSVPQTKSLDEIYYL